MDVRSYIRLIIKNWHILLISMVVTVAATLVFTLRQPRIYESVSTFVIRPHSSLILQDEFVSTLDTLSRRVEINNTFAEVTTSKLIEDRAVGQLGLSSDQRQGLSAEGRVLLGTNILELIVRGNDPQVVQSFAEAVSRETVIYVSSLYDVFELGQLDAASLARKPVSPKYTVNMVLGFILGVVLGLVLIFLHEYLRAPDGPQHNFDIIDHDTGVYNRAYLDMRLRQEVSRARRNDGKLSLALIRVSDRRGQHGGGATGRAAMPAVAIIFDPLLRDEDLLARYDDTTFALMMPDMSGLETQAAVEILRLRLGSAPVAPDQFKHVAILRGAAGVAELAPGDFNEENIIARAENALRDAERGTYGRVILDNSAAASGLYDSEPQAQPALASGAVNGNGHSIQVVSGDGHSTPNLPANVPAGEAVEDFDESVEDSQTATPSPALPPPPLTRAALKLAQQHDIDLDTVQGSGKDGRILKSDIKALIRNDAELGFST